MQRTRLQPLAAAMIALAAIPFARAQDSASATGEALNPIARPTARDSRDSASAHDGTTFGPATRPSSSSASDFGPRPPSADGEGSIIGDVVRPESAPSETFTSSTMVGSGVTAADQALMNRLVGALANDPQLKGAMITVQVDDGRVELSGFAQDETQAGRAREVAEGIAGMGRVSGSLDTRS